MTEDSSKIKFTRELGEGGDDTYDRSTREAERAQESPPKDLLTLKQDLIRSDSTSEYPPAQGDSTPRNGKKSDRGSMRSTKSRYIINYVSHIDES
jgi:hypothetical protein